MYVYKLVCVCLCVHAYVCISEISDSNDTMDNVLLLLLNHCIIYKKI